MNDLTPASDLTDLIGDYDFDLPEGLIAQDPAPERAAARLLLVRREPEPGMPRFEDLRVSDLPALLKSEKKLARSLWIRNRSRVIPARFYARRSTGGRHEIVLLEEQAPGVWKAIVRNQAAFHYPQKLAPEARPELEFVSAEPGVLDFRAWREPVLSFLESAGEMPLPPYIKKRIPGRDKDRYQAVWSRPDRAASVAAPTASLHFTSELCQEMNAAGADFADIILHVGLGTFEPVRESHLSKHSLHSERLEVGSETLAGLREGLAQKRPFVALGTTALRTLESLNLKGESRRPGVEFVESLDGARGRTSLFVKPGHEFRYANALFTNFHLPQSTLLVLVATFSGSRALALEAYRHAVAKSYRFFSFGDASLWI